MLRPSQPLRLEGKDSSNERLNEQYRQQIEERLPECSEGAVGPPGFTAVLTLK